MLKWIANGEKVYFFHRVQEKTCEPLPEKEKKSICATFSYLLLPTECSVVPIKSEPEKVDIYYVYYRQCIVFCCRTFSLKSQKIKCTSRYENLVIFYQSNITVICKHVKKDSSLFFFTYKFFIISSFNF